MARPEIDQKLLPSVLDRLIDQEPHNAVESEAQRGGKLRELKGALRRDLESLLNARRLLVHIPNGAEHLKNSLLLFGLPDFSTAPLDTTEEQHRLLHGIEAAVARFEPRLSQVTVTMLEGQGSDRSLRFRIEALLRVEPNPEPVSFDSTLRLPTKSFVVEED